MRWRWRWRWCDVMWCDTSSCHFWKIQTEKGERRRKHCYSNEFASLSSLSTHQSYSNCKCGLILCVVELLLLYYWNGCVRTWQLMSTASTSIVHASQVFCVRISHAWLVTVATQIIMNFEATKITITNCFCEQMKLEIFRSDLLQLLNDFSAKNVHETLRMFRLHSLRSFWQQCRSLSPTPICLP